MDPVITRFPPSPSGYLHVGGARTALFNWLYARHTGGRLVLRFEDTDTDRSSQASVDAILEALQWLGIDWDEGPYFQSQRMDIYTEAAKGLLEKGHAYACDCAPEAVEQMRREAVARGENPRYDGRCREKGLAMQEGRVLRFRAPVAGNTVLEDRVKGSIAFSNRELDDFIIIRSNGTPTYNFAVVVDDISMGINTIIRGDDHVMNTPKQICLYHALEADLPIYAHVPMVLGHDKTRLSKRHGATSTTAYRDAGYLPDAMINYLARLGWSHGDQEFFTRDELIDKFSLAHIGKAAGIFDPEKLRALNGDHIQAVPAAHLVPAAVPFFEKAGHPVSDTARLEQIIRTLQPRCKTLEEMAAAAAFYFADTIAYDEKAAKKFLKPAIREPLERLASALSAAEPFDEAHLEAAFEQVMAQTGLKLGKIAQPVRVALTGGTASPGIFEITAIIGKAEVLRRLNAAVAFIAESQ